MAGWRRPSTSISSRGRRREDHRQPGRGEAGGRERPLDVVLGEPTRGRERLPTREGHEGRGLAADAREHGLLRGDPPRGGGRPHQRALGQGREAAPLVVELAGDGRVLGDGGGRRARGRVAPRARLGLPGGAGAQLEHEARDQGGAAGLQQREEPLAPGALAVAAREAEARRSASVGPVSPRASAVARSQEGASPSSARAAQGDGPEAGSVGPPRPSSSQRPRVAHDEVRSSRQASPSR